MYCIPQAMYYGSQGVYYVTQAVYYVPQGVHYAPQRVYYALQGAHYGPQAVHFSHENTFRFLGFLMKINKPAVFLVCLLKFQVFK